MDIIFDWSGVISDDFTPVYETCMEMMRRLGGKLMSKNKFRESFFLPYMDWWHQFFPDLIQGAIDKDYWEYYRTLPPPSIYPGVKEVLHSLTARGLRLFLLSSHDQDTIHKEAKTYGVGGLFVEIIGSVHDKRLVINGLIDRHGLDRDATWYVGDMTHDIDAGKQANVRTVGITWGYQSEKKLRAAGADSIIHDLQGLLTLLFFRQ